MKLILTFTLVLGLVFWVVFLLLSWLWRVVRKPEKKSPLGRRLLKQTALALVFAILTLPLLLGYLGSRMVGTRHDERAYRGPHIVNGTWQLQSRDSLRKDPGPEDNPYRVTIQSEDGIRLRAFLVPSTRPKPRATVVMVHGLFRGGLELETVAAMFHRLGCEVLMLEARNHGESDRRPFTYGLHESKDVLAAVRLLEKRQGGAAPLVLFGVSMGTALVALAAPEIPGLRGLVLDAPMTDLPGCADRMLRRSVQLPGFLASVVRSSIEFWSGFDMKDVDVTREVSRLSPQVCGLIIGGGKDQRMPPAVVRAVHAALPAATHHELWLAADAKHGQVWVAHPTVYENRLKRLLERMGTR